VAFDRDTSSKLAFEFIEFIEQQPNTVQGLMRRVLSRCRSLSSAQAGTIFILRRRGRQRFLHSVSVQNDLIKISREGFIIPVGRQSIAGYVAETGETLFLDDIQNLPPESPFTFNASFDTDSGFRTRTMMSFPIVNFDGVVMGVVQLINACPNGVDVVPFDRDLERVITPVNNIVGRAVERADAAEQLQEKNAQLRRRNLMLRQQRERVEQLRLETEDAFMTTVQLLARAAELHDDNTGQHVSRVSRFSTHMAELAGQNKEFCRILAYSATLHDVGKMSIDVAILHKPGRLTEEEFQEMQNHTLYGWRILRGVDRLAMAAEIALSHHEQWLGGGYPQGLAGDNIPISARIVAFADVYDALRSERPYKPAFDHAHTMKIMTEGDNRLRPADHFDPKLLTVFTHHHQDFERIYQEITSDDSLINPDKLS
jgi:HD-GYP domain-containing protein (c-di-GMP phosphodiesterase class II)